MLDDVEARLGCRLPDAYRRLLLEVSNGGAVEPAGIDGAPQVGPVAVLGVGRGDDLDIERRAAQYEGRLPDGLVPVADAEGGNLVCVSCRPDDAGTIWFWDHECEADEGEPPSPSSVTVVADTFDELIARARPPAVIPGVVRESWIDPDLARRLGEGG